MTTAEQRTWRGIPLGPLELHPDMATTCARDPGKGTRGHHCSAWHRELVAEYRRAREAQDMRAEAATMGYATELRGFYGDPDEVALTGTERRLTFQVWLEQNRHDEPEEETWAS